MKLFIDSSAWIAAAIRPDGGSGEIIEAAGRREWTLLVNSFVLREVDDNLGRMGREIFGRGMIQRRAATLVDDIVTVDRPVVFPVAKDRPILFTALGRRRPDHARPSRLPRTARNVVLRTGDSDAADVPRVGRPRLRLSEHGSVACGD